MVELNDQQLGAVTGGNAADVFEGVAKIPTVVVKAVKAINTAIALATL
jgi:hypothetical protein